MDFLKWSKKWFGRFAIFAPICWNNKSQLIVNYIKKPCPQIAPIMDKQNIISKHIGILCAMPEEVGSTLDNLKNIETKLYGDLKIYSGD